MLKKGQQKKHFLAAWESMHDHLLSFYTAREQEDLHSFRIQVKKIKAMLLFLQEKPATRQLKALQSIFEHAGRIRSAYVNLRLISQYQLTDIDFKTEQENILEQEIRRFCRKQKNHIKTLKKIYPVLVGGFHNIDDQSVVKLFKKKLKTLSRFFTTPGFDTDKLHKNRKRIKNLFYLHLILPDSLADTLHLDITYLDKLQDQIGKWHDLVLAIELLEREKYADKKLMATLHRQSRRRLASIDLLSDEFASNEPI